jgi:hypothetical protein
MSGLLRGFISALVNELFDTLLNDCLSLMVILMSFRHVRNSFLKRLSIGKLWSYFNF